MAAVKACRVAWSAGAAIALWMIVNSSAWAGVWSPSPQSPQMVGIYNGKSQYVTGQTLVVVEGQTLKLLGRSMDIDTLTEGSTTTPSLDVADVLWTASAGSVAPSRARSEDEVVVTPPDVPQGQPYTTFTVMAQADDNRTQDDPPGSLAPHTGNRNDAYGTTQTVTIKVIKECPTAVSISSTCTHPQDWTAFWTGEPGIRTYGFLAARMAVSGGSPPNPPNNWNGLVIKEVLTLHPTDPGTGTDSDFENGWTPTKICAGSCQFVVGVAAGVPPRGVCVFPAADNSFWDFHSTGPLSYTMLKAGLPTKTVNCRQVYKCKDTNLTPSFKITRSFSNVTVGGYRRNQVPTTKTAE